MTHISHQALLRLKERLQPPQHIVDGLREPPQFIGWHGDRDALAQVLGVCDLLGGFGNRRDGPQGRARQNVPDHRCQYQRQCTSEKPDATNNGQRVIHAAQAGRHLHDTDGLIG